MPRYLSGWVFVSKYFGLMTACGAGLFLGTEGPFVHMSSILAVKMMKLRFFSSLTDNPALMHQILSAAVTAGVAASLASPIGGLMFSIEVSSNYWPIRRYLKSPFSSFSSFSFFLFFFFSSFSFSSFSFSSFSSFSFSSSSLSLLSF